jgi:hypothetical protein
MTTGGLMKRFSIIDPLHMSFYSRDLYRDVAANWSTASCVLYLLSLLALCWVPGIIRLDTDISYYVTNEAPKLIAQMPEIVISQGAASIREPQPFIIKDPDTGEPFMIIDTTGGTKNLDNTKAVILLARETLVVKTPDDKQQALELRELGDGTITKPVANAAVERFTEWFGILLYPFAVLFGFVFRAVQAAIIALFGMILTRSLRANLDYRQMLRLSLVAITPLIVFNSLCMFFRLEMPIPLLADLVLLTSYQVFAIRSNSEQTAE